MNPRLRFKSIEKSFGGTQALHGVSFDVAPGCVHAIVGENGAGKSTLIKVLAGVFPADAGSIELDGVLFRPPNPRASNKLGVATVHQELAVIPHLSVAENIFLDRLPLGRSRLVIDRRELHRLTQKHLEKLGLELVPQASVGSLSIAQQQMVEIARALSLEARVLVLDEPSAVLSPREVDALFAFVRRLVERGVCVLYVSHRLEEIFELCDMVTVLRDGLHISTRPIGEVTTDLLIQEMVGRPLGGRFPARDVERGEVVLKLDGLCSRGRFEDVSFQVHAGEVFGLTGLVGSGRSSIARAIFGAAPVTNGKFRIVDRSGPFRNPRTAQQAGVALVPEDRQNDGLLLHRCLRENLTLADLSNHSSRGVFRRSDEKASATRMMARHGIRAPGTETSVHALSGGNQQKVLIARWLERAYPLIVLDEPTRGVDVGAKYDIYCEINSIAERNGAVLMISSELPEIISMCDRIGVMCNGRLAGILDNADRSVSQERIMTLAVGGSAS